MKKAIKEFIIQEHANACGEWKAMWEQKYPELFKTQFKVGDWVKLTADYLGGINKGDVYQIVIPQNEIKECFIVDHRAFNKEMEHGRNYLAPWRSILTPATNKEVEAALIAEAKMRGFKEGVRVNPPYDGWSKNLTLISTENEKEAGFTKEYYKENENEFIYYGILLFKDGKWATIIEEEKPSLSIMEKNQIPEDIKDLKQSISKLEIQFAKLKDKIDKL